MPCSRRTTPSSCAATGRWRESGRCRRGGGSRTWSRGAYLPFFHTCNADGSSFLDCVSSSVRPRSRSCLAQRKLNYEHTHAWHSRSSLVDAIPPHSHSHPVLTNGRAMSDCERIPPYFQWRRPQGCDSAAVNGNPFLRIPLPEKGDSRLRKMPSRPCLAKWHNRQRRR